MCLSAQFSAVHSVPAYDTLSKETVATIVRALTIHWIKEIKTVSDILIVGWLRTAQQVNTADSSKAISCTQTHLTSPIAAHNNII